MKNRLAGETSPYLLQHQENPVDWYPWADEAFQRAVAEDKPVFLSVGYSSCHWCHVMEHESFEDQAIADLLNESFISVKVDREERPDVDEAYMTAVQLTSGRGGWPMSVFLTPDRKPFFAGTYFPKADRGQTPGFTSVLTQIAAMWRTRRTEVQSAADQLAEALVEASTTQPPDADMSLDASFVQWAVETIGSSFDSTNGGFGNAPKFPPHAGLEFNMLVALQPWAPMALRETALGIAAITLEKMCLGGIHDHVGGGFHRYSTDERWLLPHFEKMLYDNALMLGNLARMSALVAHLDEGMSSLFLRSAQGIVGWLEREMTAPEGWFYSALDADSEGEEGKFYVWTIDQASKALAGDPTEFLDAYNFHLEGNFHDEATGRRTGANIPHLSENDSGRFEAELTQLRVERERRIRPGLDDKAIVAWNGIAIGSLAEAGILGMAERAALAILNAESAHGHLPHQIAKGVASGHAYLDDYAWLADGLLKLAGLTEVLQERGVPTSHAAQFWRDHSARLADAMLGSFYDPSLGGFTSTSDAHEKLFGRTRPVFDQPIPSGNAVALRVLIDLGHSRPAEDTARALMGWMQRAPQATEGLLAACLPLIPAEAPASAEQPVPTIEPAKVAVALENREWRADSQGRARSILTLTIPDGWHVNSNTPAARWLVPTQVVVQPIQAQVSYPEGLGDEWAGVIDIGVSLELPEDQREAEFELIVTYQACTQSECLAPVERRYDCVVHR